MKDIIKWILICGALVLILFISGVWLDGCVKANQIAYAKYDERLSSIENQLKTKLDIPKKDVEEQISNPDCPTLDEDFFSNIWITNYCNRVVVYRRVVEDGAVIFPNVMFCATKDGLVLDGVLNAEYELQINSFGTTDWKNSNNKFVTSFDKIPSFGSKGETWDGKSEPNAVSLSAPDQFHYAGWNFWDALYCGKFYREKTLATIKVKDDNGNEIGLVERFVSDIFNKYFMDIDGLPILVDKDDKTEMFMDAMEFYTYLLKSCSENSILNEAQNVVDVSDYLVHVIPEEERKNYPREIVGGITQSTWSVFRQNKYMVCFYRIFLNDKITAPKDIEIVQKKYPLTPPPAQSEELDLVRFKLVNKNNSNLMGYNYETNPVSITINDKTYKFDTKDKFENGIPVALKPDNTYSYSLESSVLVFDSYSGSFELKKHEATWKDFSNPYRGQTLELNYSYTSGYVMTSISLNPLSSFSTSSIDLSANPVKIILNGKNNEGTYQFIFDKNEDVTATKRLLVRCGEYDYSILSNQLIFANETGTLTITPSERSYKFNFSVNTSSVSGNLHVSFESADSTPENSSYFHYSFNDASAMESELKTSDTDTINLCFYVYNLSGVIVLQREFSLADLSGFHSFRVSGSEEAGTLEDGQYFVGIKIEGRTENNVFNGKTISSNPIELAFSANKNYTFTISFTLPNF